MTNAQLLQKLWLHSREEDSGDSIIYRPESYKFPPARGREGMEFLAGGVYSEISPGPADRRARRPGTWTLTGDSILTIRVDGAADVIYQLVEVSGERLVLRRG
ncbi:MAG: hypothetical protein HY286_07815 [Planctomycetes bacterium]|nr:hypothetical protein [Planctomycetota bacterium]